jgi:hypothetical protein
MVTPADKVDGSEPSSEASACGGAVPSKMLQLRQRAAAARCPKAKEPFRERRESGAEAWSRNDKATGSVDIVLLSAK